MVQRPMTNLNSNALLTLWCLLIVLPSKSRGDATTTLPSSNDTNDDIILWSSTGGGWRSMMASMGFANIFQQAGLFSAEESRFDAISTNSGSAWFSTQAFYSPKFYQDTVMASSPQTLKDFALQWMNSYRTVASDYVRHDVCNFTTNMLLGVGDDDDANNSNNQTTTMPNGTGLQALEEICNLLVDYNGDWAAFVGDMLQETSSNYGDPSLTSRLVQGENRISPLQDTDLLFQSSLAPTLRLRSPRPQWKDDILVTLGTIDGDDESSSGGSLSTVALSAPYTVNSSFSGFQYNVETYDGSRNNALHTYTESISPTTNVFREFDKKDYPLYPSGKRDEAAVPLETDKSLNEPLHEPFDGSATVLQVAAASSAAAGVLSPMGPSCFAQFLSKFRPSSFNEGIAKKILVDRAVQRLYETPLLDGFAVCSQWPRSCGSNDAVLMDGEFVGSPTVATNVGQHQSSSSSSSNDLDRKTIKLVWTNTNAEWGTPYLYAQLLQYFSNPQNDNVVPGEFIWYPAMYLPYRSPQIFDDFLDEASLDALLEPIEGSRITTARISATTIDNPAFNIRAGQRVELLLINLNEPITTYVLGPTVIGETTGPLTEMVFDIAANRVLLERVQEFFGPAGRTETSGGNTEEGRRPARLRGHNI